VLHQDADEAFSATTEAGGGLSWHGVSDFTLGRSFSSTPTIRFFSGQADPPSGGLLSIDPSIWTFLFEFLEAPSPGGCESFQLISLGVFGGQCLLGLASRRGDRRGDHFTFPPDEYRGSGSSTLEDEGGFAFLGGSTYERVSRYRRSFSRLVEVSSSRVFLDFWKPKFSSAERLWVKESIYTENSSSKAPLFPTRTGGRQSCPLTETMRVFERY